MMIKVLEQINQYFVDFLKIFDVCDSRSNKGDHYTKQQVLVLDNFYDAGIQQIRFGGKVQNWIICGGITINDHSIPKITMQNNIQQPEQYLRCSNGGVSTCFCKSLRCKKNSFICGNKLCKCYQNHKKCRTFRRENIQILQQLVYDQNNIDNCQTLLQNLDILISLYKKLSARIIQELLDLEYLKQTFRAESSLLQIVNQKIQKGTYLPIAGCQMIKILNVHKVNRKGKQQLSDNIQKIQKDFSDINIKFQFLRTKWDFLQQLNETCSQDNTVKTLDLCFRHSDKMTASPLIQALIDLKKSKYNSSPRSKNQLQSLIRRQRISQLLNGNRHLQKLNLFNKDIQNQDFQLILQKVKTIKNLHLNSSTISIQNLLKIHQNYPLLQTLNLYRIKIYCTNGGQQDSQQICKLIKSFCEFKNLKHLDLSFSHLRFEHLESLLRKGMSKLRKLNLKFNFLTDEGAILLGLNFPKLKELDVRNCQINDFGLIAISKGIERLRIFKGGNDPYARGSPNNQLTQDSVQVLCRTQTSLQVLNLDAEKIRKGSITSIVITQLSGLHELSLNNFYYKQLSASQLFYICKLKNLQKILDRSGFSNHTCKGLFSLKMPNCLQKISRNLRNLKICVQRQVRGTQGRLQSFRIRNVFIMKCGKLQHR